jgi:hypothetical protein
MKRYSRISSVNLFFSRLFSFNGPNGNFGCLDQVGHKILNHPAVQAKFQELMERAGLTDEASGASPAW